MKLSSLIVLACMAGYSGGDFFTPMSSLHWAARTDDSTGLHFGNPTEHKASGETASTLFSLPTCPLPQAHAHNDYEHPRPLWDALEQGFTYIEADVHLIDNELFVSHLTPLFPSQERTLRALYLDPLLRLSERNKGAIFQGSNAPLHLMVDIKSGADETYQVLKTYLEPYRQMLTSFENGVKTERAVTVFLSGNRPIGQLLAEKSTLMFLDGRIEDLGRGIPADLMPVVSERFSNIFGWEIFGQERPENQWLILRRLAHFTHAEGKKLRLWASPEQEPIWEKMLDAGCDLINTDELRRLRLFLQRRSMGSHATR